MIYRIIVEDLDTKKAAQVAFSIEEAYEDTNNLDFDELLEAFIARAFIGLKKELKGVGV